MSYLSGHPLNAYSISGGCLCADLAFLLRGLLRSIGADGNVTFYWAGTNSSAMRQFIEGSSGNTGPTFRVLRAAHDSASLNPHFSYHAIVPSGGLLYDPSYGISYSALIFNETAFNNTPQQTSTTFPTSAFQSGWICPH